MTAVNDYADNVLSQQLSQISGVAQVFIGGAQKPAVRVQVDPGRLASMGLTLEDVRNMLVNATVDAPKGALDGRFRTYTLYDNDQLTTAAEYQNVILAYRNGAPVRVRDIGRAIDGPENTLTAGFQNGRPAVLIVVFKQPGANVISTVEAIKARLPQLEASIPPSVHVAAVSDRTQTIRASVEDVQFTLLLAIALVVMVIFIFLRNVWATVIPGVTVPLALVGTFAAMYLLDFSLDNLSLMALTIAVGFVIDDAIVMLENIYRHIEEGMKPMEAAIKGAGEIGFTIVSISASLIAVFIPLLLMGGIVGRLFREFAVTVAIAVTVSAFVSLTLTPMMCSRFLRHDHARHGLAYRAIEAFFTGMLAFYRRTLDVALRFQFITLLVFFATVALTITLYIEIPKGFFPEQDNGIIYGYSDAAQDVSFAAMKDRQLALGKIISDDPDVCCWGSVMGAGQSGLSENSGRYFITLKPFSQRTATAQQIVQRISEKAKSVIGARLSLQASQDIRVGGRVTRTAYEYTLQDANVERALRAGAESAGEAPHAAAAARRGDRPADERRHRHADHRPRRSRALRHPPAVIDQTLVRRVRPARDHPVLHPAQHLPRDHGGAGGAARRHQGARQAVREIGERPAVPLSTFVKLDTNSVAPLSISHRASSLRSRSPSTSPGAALGNAVNAIQRARCGNSARRFARRQLPGHGRRSSPRSPRSPI